MKILIVDDQYENRKLMKDILKPYGTCDLVGDGEEAVDLFTEQLLEGTPYDLVFLDIMMPGMDGQEALKEMRAAETREKVVGGEESVIIMVTALDSPQQVMQAYFKGWCTDYLTKPITPKIIFDKMRAYNLLPVEEGGAAETP